MIRGHADLKRENWLEIGVAGRFQGDRPVSGIALERVFHLGSRMYEITVQTEFCAGHSLVIGGQREKLHGHNWKVKAVIAGGSLDHDGLLCDFHTCEEVLQEICEPFHNENLDDREPFVKGVNPSAEHVARYIATEMASRLDDALKPHARVQSVSVTEAPGCIATYRVEKS